MRICVFSLKGGVGKTSLSTALALELGLHVQTNDVSNIISIVPGGKFNKKFIDRDNTLYDFGGFPDESNMGIIDNADALIVPVISEANAMLKCLETIKKFKNHKRIIIVGTMIDSEKDKNDIKMIIQKHFNSLNIEFSFIRRTALFKNAAKEAKSPLSYMNSNNLYKKTYESAYKDFFLLKRKFA